MGSMNKAMRNVLLLRTVTGIVRSLACALLLPSVGHTAAPGCSVSALVPGWQVVTVHSGGLDRKVPVYVPAVAAGRSHLPLVFDLHGSGGNGRQQAQHSGFTAQADQYGFVVANPNGGIADPDSPTDRFYWHVPGVPLIGSVQMPANAPDDVQFFRDAIGQLEQAACVDPARIYVAGFSGGARMASALACDLSEQIAAVAPVAACAQEYRKRTISGPRIRQPVNRVDPCPSSRFMAYTIRPIASMATVPRGGDIA